MRYLLFALILTSCLVKYHYYSVEKVDKDYICQHHVHEKSWTYVENIAFCKTAEECRKTCDEERRK